MKYEKLCKSIVSNIVNKSNVVSVTHCMTRLRIEVQDTGKVDLNKLKNLDGTLGAVLKGNQVQVVIGNEVNAVYNDFVDFINGTSKQKSDIKLSERILNNISAIFNPLVPALAGSGLIKALLVVLKMSGLLSAESETYIVLSTLSDGIFYFMPMALAYSSAKVFKCNPFCAVALAGTLMHPNFTNLISDGTSTVHFLSIPINLIAYNGTILPVVLGVWFMSYVERFIDSIMPKALKIVFVPMITMLIAIPITLMVVGPTAQFVGNNLSNVLNSLIQQGGIFAGIIYGALQPLIVVLGLQHGMLPIQMDHIARLGYNRISPITGNNNCGQAGACLGVMLKSKDPRTKSVALSACLGGVMGISEPAIYGVTLRLKKPFIAAMIGGACGGAFNAFFQCQAYAIGGPSFVTLAMFMSEENPMNVVYVAIGFTISFVVAAIAAYLLGFEEDVEIALEDKEQSGSIVVEAPITGDVVSLSEVNDEVFSSGTMGEGIAVMPKDKNVYAPVSGIIRTVFKPGHAIGIVGDNGEEIIIHMGIDSVKHVGVAFDTKVEVGDHVVKGQLISTYDYECLVKEGIDPTVVMVITNSKDFSEVTTNKEKRVKNNVPLLMLQKG